MAWSHRLKAREVIHVDAACTIELDPGNRRRLLIRRKDGGRATCTIARKPAAQRGLKRTKS